MLQDADMDTCQEDFQSTFELVSLSLEHVEKDTETQAHNGHILRQTPLEQVLTKGVL